MFGMDGSDVRMAIIKKSEDPFHDKHASKRLLGMGVGGSSARKKRNTPSSPQRNRDKWPANAKKGKRRRFQKQMFLVVDTIFVHNVVVFHIL